MSLSFNQKYSAQISEPDVEDPSDLINILIIGWKCVGFWQKGLGLFSLKHVGTRGSSARHVACWQICVNVNVKLNKKTCGLLPFSWTFYLNIQLSLLTRLGELKKSGPFVKPFLQQATTSCFCICSIDLIIFFSICPSTPPCPFLILIGFMMTDLHIGQATCKVIMGKWTCGTHGPLTSILTLTATTSN